MMMRALLLYRWLQQGRRHSLILKTNALLLRRPPLHKLVPDQVPDPIHWQNNLSSMLFTDDSESEDVHLQSKFA